MPEVVQQVGGKWGLSVSSPTADLTVPPSFKRQWRTQLEALWEAERPSQLWPPHPLGFPAGLYSPSHWEINKQESQTPGWGRHRRGAKGEDSGHILGSGPVVKFKERPRKLSWGLGLFCKVLLFFPAVFALPNWNGFTEPDQAWRPRLLSGSTARQEGERGSCLLQEAVQARRKEGVLDWEPLSPVTVRWLQVPLTGFMYLPACSPGTWSL